LQIREPRVQLDVLRGDENIMSRGRPFEPGNTFSQGRPKGSRNKSTSAGRQLLERHHEALMNKNIVEALRGDTTSRLWSLTELSRGTPRAPNLKLTPIKTVDDIAKAYEVVLQAVANHKCTAPHGQSLFAMLGERRKMIETEDLAHRLEWVEAELKKTGSK
jgi:predicted PP-loop superfamily ATPase